MNYSMFLDTATQGAAQTGGGQTTGGGTIMIIYVVLIIAFFYFFMIRPQKKQEKQTAAMRNSLEIGDEITTIGGVVGRVSHIKDDIITIETGADRVRIRFKKSAIASVDKKSGEEKSAPKGGYKVTKKSEGVIKEAPELKDDNKESK